jgi:hypothetical protein
VRFPKAQLPGGALLHFKVRANNGLYSAERQATIDGVRPAELDLVMLRPVGKYVVTPERPVRLEAVASLSGARAHDIRFTWFIDGKEIAAGARSVWERAEPGEHEVAVVARLDTLDARRVRTITVRQALKDQ